MMKELYIKYIKNKKNRNKKLENSTVTYIVSRLMSMFDDCDD